MTCSCWGREICWLWALKHKETPSRGRRREAKNPTQVRIVPGEQEAREGGDSGFWSFNPVVAERVRLTGANA